MKVVKTNLAVHYSPAQMYDLVADIAAYPEFLPWCNGSKISKQAGNTVEASLSVSKGPFQQSFATRNTMDEPNSIQLELLDGPFSHLEGYWFFKPIDGGNTKVEFIIEFEFINPILSATLSPVFNSITKSMVEAFHLRAKQVYD